MAAADASKPVLTSLTVPGTIDLTKGLNHATFVVGATDVGSGVVFADVELDNGSTILTDLTFGIPTDTFADGTSSFSLDFAATTPAGTYTVGFVQLVDKVGNVQTYNAAQLAALGLSKSFTVIGSVPHDADNPVLKSFTLPTIDVTTGSKTVTFGVAATDAGSGVDSVDVVLDRAIQSGGSTTKFLSFSGSPDSFSDGQSTLAEVIDSTTGAGTYNIVSVDVYDKQNNIARYDAPQLAALGISSSFTVASNTPGDTVKPVLTGLSLPASVDVTAGSNAIFTVQATDQGSGVDRVSLSLDRPFLSHGTSTSLLTFSNSTDSFADGQSSLTRFFDNATAAGTFNIGYAIVYDKAGNSHYYAPDDLAALGIATSFTVADHSLTPTASVAAPAFVVEGLDNSFGLDLTLKGGAAGSGTFTMSLATDPTIPAISGVVVPSYSGSYSVTDSAAGNAVIHLPSITVADDQAFSSGDRKIAVHIDAPGQIFANGTDQTTVLIPLLDNEIRGTAGDDVLMGHAGHDLIDGGAGQDKMYGGLGDDSYVADSQADLIFENPNEGIDSVTSTSSYYLYANTENLVLLGETPFGVGNELDNVITGNAIGNYLLGGAGNDTLNGKAGNDVLFGEAGADTFIFEKGTGGDVIGDFAPGTDHIDLSAFHFASFAAVQAAMVENGGTTAINLGSGDLIVINGVANAALHAGDFMI